MKKQILLLGAAIVLASCQSEAPSQSAPETTEAISLEAAANITAESTSAAS